MNIHPTAIVHPEAKLGENVEIGPYAVIEGPATIGDGCVIQAHAIVTGYVTMGSNNVIGYNSVIGSEPQDLGFRSEVVTHVRIGNGNRLRENCTIHRATGEGKATMVGDNCYFMAGAHLAHDVTVGNHVIIANNALLGGHVTVGDRVFLGGGSVFHQHVRVGRLVVVQGLGGVGKDIPPFCMAAEINLVASLNVVGLRRAGMSPDQRKEIKAAFDLLYRSGLNTTQAVAAAKEREWGPEAREFFAFVEGSKKRGICALMTTTSGSASSGDE